MFNSILFTETQQFPPRASICSDAKLVTGIHGTEMKRNHNNKLTLTTNAITEILIFIAVGI